MSVSVGKPEIWLDMHNIASNQLDKSFESCHDSQI